METFKFQPLPHNVFKKLATNQSKHSVSIYLPMYTNGKEQNEHVSQSNLSSCINKVYKGLKKRELSEQKIKEYLKPIEALLGNTELWRNPSKGLVIFLDKNELQYYSLPIAFETSTYIANNFYVLPLLTLYQENTNYYLLELSRDYVKFYEASKYGFNNVQIDDFIPNQLEDTVGFEYKQKMLQFRSGQNAYGSGSFHGQGDGKEDLEKEIATFFRAIDKGIKHVIKNKKSPLVVACIDRLFDTYKKVNTYANLYDINISGDTEFTNKTALHQESWELVQPYFEKNKQLKISQFKELYNTPKISYQLNDIIPAALNGKIDTLFVEKNTDIAGTYNKDTRKLQLDINKDLTNNSLTNLTAVQTFFNGGQVYMLSTEEMPIPGISLNAIFRY